MARNKAITLLSIGHACVDVYQGAVAALVPYFVAERAYTYAAVSGIVLAASLLSSVAQPLFGLATDRRAMPWLLPVSTLVGGLGIALSGLGDSYALTLLFVGIGGVGVAAYHPESARVARVASGGSHTAMGWFSLGGNLGFALAPVLVAVVCRSVVFIGLSTFIAFYVRQRTGGGAAAGTAALVVLYLGGAVGTVLGGALAERWDRVTVVRRSYLLTVGAVAGLVLLPGSSALYVCIALTSAGLYVPFSLQVTLAQDYLPNRVGTASGITLGLTVSVGGLFSPLIGRLADATSLRTALLPLIAMPALSWLLFLTLTEPARPDAPRRTSGGGRGLIGTRGSSRRR
ncbi:MULTISPECIES: MFS transporter [unclassified Streptomyces]|uniref:MFS transporter n=1 Tax=unclassified Streptomyces TaxID=2593676 RepID=UPI0009790183|nr:MULTISPECIES: MFS transporter [unclassified Streptomyces]ONI50223.1 Fosmidomycin resistance protein [Streptomyces sp. IB2014 011-1]RDV48749.1 MFS transporter [Streptomyces sp. IB2014 011-12]